MRSETKNGITLKFPDEVGFVFNPCLFIAEGENMAHMQLTMTDEEGNSADVTYQAFRNGCYADVREYVQTFFDTMAFGNVDYQRVVKTSMGKNFTIKVWVVKNDETEASFEVSVFYIWGALKIGGQETYNGHRVLTWFRGFPFSFGIFSLGGSLLFCRDGVPDRFENTDGRGVYNVPMLESDDCKSFFTIKDCTGAFVAMTFDSTFDMTFKYSGGGEKTEKLRINVIDGEADGYYLRWIDRHGFYCYYLFKAGEESRKTTAEDKFVRNNLLAYDMSYGYEGYTGRQQQMSREDTIPVCAPLVDSETFDMLFDVATSPCVDLFAGYDEEGTPKWISVTVQAGTYKKSTQVLQDFVCHIVMPDVSIQKL